jgi:hypothetical protein
MAVDLSGKARSLLDLPVGLILQDIASDGRVLVTLKSQRLAMSFGKIGRDQDVDLSWHDWNSARDISRDGQFVLSEDASESAGQGYAVVLRKVDGTPPILLGEGSAGAISPDGKWASSTSTSNPTQVTLLPIGPGQPRIIDVSGLAHIQNSWARFLPDGKQLTVNADAPTHERRCYVVELSSGVAKAVTPDGVLCGPSSPDGRSLIGKGPAGSSTIYSLEGGAPRLIPHMNPKFNALRWADNSSLLYGNHIGEFPSKIYKVEIATGKETVMQEIRPATPTGVVMVAPIVVSSDGRSLAYSYNQTLSVLNLISGLH